MIIVQSMTNKNEENTTNNTILDVPYFPHRIQGRTVRPDACKKYKININIKETIISYI